MKPILSWALAGVASIAAPSMANAPKRTADFIVLSRVSKFDVSKYLLRKYCAIFGRLHEPADYAGVLPIGADRRILNQDGLLNRNYAAGDEKVLFIIPDRASKSETACPSQRLCGPIAIAAPVSPIRK